MRSMRSGKRCANARPTPPQSCITSVRRSSPSCGGERFEEAVVAGDRVVEVGGLRGAAEARQVRGDPAEALEEGDPVVRVGRHAVQVEDRRVAGLAQVHLQPVHLDCALGDLHGRGSYHHAVSGRSTQAPRHPRPPPQGVRATGAAPAPRADRRARAHGALAEHERPQPRRGLRAAARALLVLGRGTRLRRSRRSRTRSVPAGSLRPRRCGSSRSSVRSATTTSPGWRRRRWRRPATTSANSPASAGRRRPACCSSRTAARRCRWTRTCTAWAPGSGLWPEKTSLEQAHDEMLRLVAPEDAYEMHVLLIRHGRRTCTARNPDCPGCPLLRMCPEGKRRVS